MEVKTFNDNNLSKHDFEKDIHGFVFEIAIDKGQGCSVGRMEEPFGSGTVNKESEFYYFAPLYAKAISSAHHAYLQLLENRVQLSANGSYDTGLVNGDYVFLYFPTGNIFRIILLEEFNNNLKNIFAQMGLDQIVNIRTNLENPNG